MKKEFHKFPSINQFHNAVSAGNRFKQEQTMMYVKTKLHGTNAGIVITPEGAYAQSRERVLTVDDDNAGFAKFVDELSINSLVTDGRLVIYGEWAGPGIQKGTSIQKIDKKRFFVFAILSENNIMITRPSDVIQIVGMYFGSKDRFHVLPATYVFDINFNGSTGHLKEVSDDINEIVNQYETVDPFVKDIFGIEGPGEGVVVVPHNVHRDEYSRWAFKAKTEKHRTNKTKSAAKAQTPITETEAEFVEMFATEARFNQAMTELQIDFDMKNIGQFLKWVNQDVIKESVDEREASDLEWKRVSKFITTEAKKWFMRNTQIF